MTEREEPNEAQKAAMVAFCIRKAGDIAYVPVFDSNGVCTVSKVIAHNARIRATVQAASEVKG